MEKKQKLLEYVEENLDDIDISTSLQDALESVMDDAEEDGIKLKPFTKKEKRKLIDILKDRVFNSDDSVFYEAIDEVEIKNQTID